MTSRARSSNRRASALLATLGLVTATAAACSHGAGNAPAGAGSVGYVRMDDLVSKDPLYGQLSKYDQDIAALAAALGRRCSRSRTSGAELQKQEVVLRRELQNAADRTRDLAQAEADGISGPRKRGDQSRARRCRRARRPGCGPGGRPDPGHLQRADAGGGAPGAGEPRHVSQGDDRAGCRAGELAARLAAGERRPHVSRTGRIAARKRIDVRVAAGERRRGAAVVAEDQTLQPAARRREPQGHHRSARRARPQGSRRPRRHAQPRPGDAGNAAAAAARADQHGVHERGRRDPRPDDGEAEGPHESDARHADQAARRQGDRGRRVP